MKSILKNLNMKKEAAFTLIEMMIVLVIISILLLIAIPNLEQNRDIANDKGCKATVELIKAQKIAYEIENDHKLTDLEVLVSEEYVDTLKCPKGDKVTLAQLEFEKRDD